MRVRDIKQRQSLEGIILNPFPSEPMYSPLYLTTCHGCDRAENEEVKRRKSGDRLVNKKMGFIRKGFKGQARF